MYVYVRKNFQGVWLMFIEPMALSIFDTSQKTIR